MASFLQSLVTPTKAGDCFSSAVLSNGNPYGIAEGLVFSMPCRSTVRTPKPYVPTGTLLRYSGDHQSDGVKPFSDVWNDDN